MMLRDSDYCGWRTSPCASLFDMADGTSATHSRIDEGVQMMLEESDYCGLWLAYVSVRQLVRHGRRDIRHAQQNR
jgi:hypothetical protein